MAQSILHFDAVIPAGTPIADPIDIPLELDNWDIESIDLEVPPGAQGLMGFAIYNNGVQWIPSTPNTYIVWDDTAVNWPLENQPNASGWSVRGYNDGFYPHTVTIRFHVNPTTPADVALPTPVVNITTTPINADPVTL